MRQSDELSSISELFSQNKGKIVLSVIAVILSSSCLLPIGYLTKKIIDDAIQSNEVNTLLLWTSLMVFLILSHLIGTLSIRSYISKFIKQYLFEVRTNLCQNVLSLSRMEAEKINVSDSQVKIVTHIERLDVMFHAIIIAVLPATIMIFGLSILLFIINVKLALVIAFSAPVLGVILYLNKRKGANKIKAYHHAHEAFNFKILETLKGLFLVQDEVLQKDTLLALENKADQLKSSGYRLGVFGFNQSHIQEALVSLLGVVILIIGGILVFQKQMSLGDLLGFYFVVFIIRRYFSDLVRAIPQVQEGFISYQKIGEVFKSEIHGSAEETLSSPIKKIRLDNIGFWYQPSQIILKDLNYTFEKGITYLIKGENGSGKTSLFNLLAQNYVPKNGSILINEIENSKLDSSNVKLKMGILPQSPLFFNRSIKENIIMGRAIEDTIFQQAIQFANLDSFVLDLPDQYDTLMGDEGIFLSGGQKQKIALARTLVKNPDFILLDEPTNHLDRQSINHLIEQLKSLQNPPGIVVISHDEVIESVADTVLNLSNQSLQITKG